MRYTLSFWNHKKDNAVQRLYEGDWEGVVSILSEYKQLTDKTKAGLFSLARFDALTKKTGEFVGKDLLDRRIGANVTEVGALIIDYDNDALVQKLWTIDEVAEKFKQYEFFIYSSYRHKVISEHIEKFRLILPFSKPLIINDHEDYKLYSEYFEQLVGFIEPGPLPKDMQYTNDVGTIVTVDKSSIDRASFKLAQGYFLPSCPIGRKVEYRINHGEFINPDTFVMSDRKTYVEVDRTLPTEATLGGDGVILRHTFDAVSWFKDNGLYMKPIGSTKHSVICPWVHEHSNGDKTGTVILKSKDGGLDGLSCQHSHKKSMWDVVQMLGDEGIRPYCMTRPKQDPIEEFLRMRKEKKVEPKVEQDGETKAKVDPVLIYDDISSEPPVLPYDRDKRREIIERRCRQDRDLTLLKAFEGYGKSYSAALKAMAGKKVLFASHSNEQAVEQAESFKRINQSMINGSVEIQEGTSQDDPHGICPNTEQSMRPLRVQVITGREYKLREQYGVQVQEKEDDEATHPWSMDNIDEPATKQWMIDNQERTKQEVEEIWEATKPEQPDWDNHDMVCTTIARVSVWGRLQARKFRESYKSIWKQHPDASKGDWKIKSDETKYWIKDEDRIIPRGTTIFYDDPDKSFFTQLYPYNEKFKDTKIDGQDIITTVVNGHPYFVRPEQFTLGYGLLDTYKIFTTTELMTEHLILNTYGKENVYVPRLMPKQRMIAGDITFIKTDLVGAKRDGFIPLIVTRLKKEGFNIELIADGVGSKYNLVNTKGQNIFADKDLIIEISEPHYEQVQWYVDELGWDASYNHAVKVALALDAVQQAIGRNSGYRWSDLRSDQRKSCVVLCEPKLHKSILQRMRYYVDTVIDVPENRAVLRKEYGDIVGGLCWFIRNFNVYLISGLGSERDAIMNDYKTLIDETSSWAKRYQYTMRLKVALKEKFKNATPKLKERIGKIQRRIGGSW